MAMTLDSPRPYAIPRTGHRSPDVLSTRTVECTACGEAVSPGQGAVITAGTTSGFAMYAVTHYVTECVRVITNDDGEIIGTV